MHTLQNAFIHGIVRFILEQGGDIDHCHYMGDYITEASRIADEKHSEPPCLNFQKFYCLESCKMQQAL